MGSPSQGGQLRVPRTRLVTPNYAEAVAAAGPAVPPRGHQLICSRSATAAAGQLSRSWEADAVVVTLGEHGAVLLQGDAAPLVAPAQRLAVTDACGAGDRFAAAAAAAYSAGVALTSGSGDDRDSGRVEDFLSRRAGPGCTRLLPGPAP